MTSSTGASSLEGLATRAFIAVVMPEEVRDLISRHVERLQGLVPRGVKWVDPKTSHLTLAFFASAPTSQIPTVVRILDSVAAASPPLRLKAGSLGVFPNSTRPRVIWLGLQGDLKHLSVMHERLHNALASEGFSRERRPFKPHVTLGRARGKGPISLPEWSLPSPEDDRHAFSVNNIVLMSSVLTPRGPIHTPLHRAGLSAPGSILPIENEILTGRQG